MRLRILLTLLALAPLGVHAHEGHDHDHDHAPAPAKTAAAPATTPHVHGPDCDHDHDHAHPVAPAKANAPAAVPHVHGPDCDHDHAPAAGATAHSHAAGEENPLVALSPVQRENLRLRLAPIVPGKIAREAFALGELVDDPRGESAASSRVAGRVVELRVALGDRVKKGDTLAVVEARQAGGEPARVPVVALADGTVHEMLTRLGEPVSPDAPLLRLADHTRLVAEARVPQRHAAALLAGKTRARVTLEGGDTRELTLAGFAPQADAVAGTLTARFPVANADHALTPGRRAEFRLLLDEKEHALTVPREAVHGERGDLFVFIENTPGVYEKHPVVVVDTDATRAAVTGPAAGEKVVVHGGAALRYAGAGDLTMQEALATAHGPDCGHDHSQDLGHRHAAPKTAAPAPVAHTPAAPAAAHVHGPDCDHDHAPASAGTTAHAVPAAKPAAKPADKPADKTAVQAAMDAAHGHAHAADGSELAKAEPAGTSFFNSHQGVIFFAIIALGEAPLLVLAIRALRRAKKDNPDA